MCAETWVLGVGGGGGGGGGGGHVFRSRNIQYIMPRNVLHITNNNITKFLNTSSFTFHNNISNNIKTKSCVLSCVF